MTRALLDHFEEQAGACELMGSPFTARLLEAMHGDLVAGGPVADLVGDWQGRPRADAVALRLAGALHAAALLGRAPALTAVYPAADPRWDPARVWAAARAVLANDRAWVEPFLRLAPQTNEPRRSIALLVGFLSLTARFDRPLELLEIGASAGLNLWWDRFSYRTDAWSWGDPAGARMETEWRGPAPEVDVRPRVRARAACDLHPLDLRDPADRLRLRAYVWPDQAERLARFDAAVEAALAGGVRVDRADAAVWLEERLSRRAPDALTVVYHSVFLQYPPRETRRAIERAIERAGESGRAPLAWLRMEPEAVFGGPRDSSRFFVDVVTWPGGAHRVLAETDGHARFVRTDR